MTEALKNQALDIISRILSDINADKQAQIVAIKEIRDLCDVNILCLLESIRSREDERTK